MCDCVNRYNPKLFGDSCLACNSQAGVLASCELGLPVVDQPKSVNFHVTEWIRTMPTGVLEISALDELDELTEGHGWSLVGRIQGRTQRSFRLGSFPFRVGRREDLVDLALGSDRVSKIHAEFVLDDGVISVRDLNSTNGTLVNGIRVQDVVPLRDGDVIQFANVEVTLRHHLPTTSIQKTKCEMTCLGSSYELRRLIGERGLVPHFQPIKSFKSGRIEGYEVLARSAVSGLASAGDLFFAAEECGLERELSELSRNEGVSQGMAFCSQVPLYLNTHPCELATPHLRNSLESLREKNPEAQIVLEIHEAAVCNRHEMRELASLLRDLSIELAYDDFGNGQSRLLELMEVPPHILKFDMQLIRGIDTASKTRQKTVESLVQMSLELGARPLAEGLETAEEAKTCAKMGFHLAQGYFCGKPSTAAAIVAKQVNHRYGRRSSKTRSSQAEVTKQIPIQQPGGLISRDTTFCLD